MSTFVKSLLVAGVLISWGAVFFMQKIFAMDALSFYFESSRNQLVYFYLEMFLVFLCWLTPFALLVLFSKDTYYVLGAFIIGVAGFFVLSQSLYALIALVFLGLGFFYWQAQVQSSLSNARVFSSYALFEGMGLFFTLFSLFIALFYLDSPVGKNISFEPGIPKGIYDVVYNQVSNSPLFQAPQHAPGIAQEKIKSTIYDQANAEFKKIALPYIQYFSIIFAAGLFLTLRGLFFPFKYILLGVVYAAARLLLALGIIRKQTIQVEKEVMEF